MPKDSSGSPTTDGDASDQALVAREIRRHRERAGLSRGELARRVGSGLASEAVVTRIDHELGAHGAQPAPTHPARSPHEAIDYVITPREHQVTWELDAQTA